MRDVDGPGGSDELGETDLMTQYLPIAREHTREKAGTVPVETSSIGFRESHVSDSHRRNISRRFEPNPRDGTPLALR